jgi:hypothetical protein
MAYREIPRSRRTLLSPVFDQMQQKNFHQAVYLVYLVFSAHLLHFRKQVEGLSVTLLLNVATQCQKLFHERDSGKDVGFKLKTYHPMARRRVTSSPLRGVLSGCTRLL